MVTDKALQIEPATAVTAARVGTTPINISKYTQPGKGTPVYIEIRVDTAFSSDTDLLGVDLINSDAAPDATDIVMVLIPPTATSAAPWNAPCTRRFALPSQGLPYDYLNISYVVPVGVTVGKVEATLHIQK